MKKKRITYGVSGMMEYQAVIKVGRNNMKVLFTDGSISAMGVNPATFTTENYMVQHAIENSTDFKRGRIKVVNTIELKEELRIERNSVKPAAEVPSPNSAPTPAPISAKSVDAPVKEDENAPDTQADNEVEAEDNEVEAEDNEVEAEDNEAAPANTQVEFSCNDDAKDYLEQTFGVVNTIELKEELRIERNSVKPAAEVPSPNSAPTPAPISAKSVDAPVKEDENAPDTQADNEVEAEDNEAAPANTQVEFSCNDDAKDYLEQTFGFVRSKLRNREDIVAAGKARGVDIIFV